MGLKRKEKLSYKVTATFFFAIEKEKIICFFVAKKAIQIDGFSKSELPIQQIATISNQVVRHCCFLGSYNYYYFGSTLHADSTPFALSLVLGLVALRGTLHGLVVCLLQRDPTRLQLG